ncbi:MAG: serine/threonine-protein phosphatase [Symploca sp. SIO3C6]|uniref:Serine/threonine-protein phosphatase n=1 Tax=Symploca sp. SIO1C4 TaxID=2607765 RepID=A0A6B3N724_9CYAN|nr:serine/threonine-protein phosphatase [Symploca sp. SIO3C6]NER26615.1 serine/threonine-protein phosphatase [Symploca sp. SIO1C4]
MSSEKQTTNHYLWAVGTATAQIPAGELVAQRYQVIAPQIWQDRQPSLPEIPETISSSNILPYLRLYYHRLHIPEVYGVCHLDVETQNSMSLEDGAVILLENVPIDTSGQLYPTIDSMWSQASAVRQVYWLWQILQLWKPLEELAVASSLLFPENLRVEGWRVRLLELYNDTAATTEQKLSLAFGGDFFADSPTANTAPQNIPAQVRIEHLGKCWESWCSKASVSIADRIGEIAQHLQAEKPSLGVVASELNQLLLEQASLSPLRLQVAGATDAGRELNHNEDRCYPTIADLPTDPEQPRDLVIPYLSIVCDGIGGHEGGEVASELAVQSIKLQVQGLLTEMAQDQEIMNPELVTQQLEAIIRVANNMIASRNDFQERKSRRRMATTLIMALQLPQFMQTTHGKSNAHEIYIASVGDSRAYWLTPRYCQLLTIDDDVATREVCMGRSLYRQAKKRPDAGALTQALGTRDGELLNPRVQRLILEEDGLLLLCSDGLSNNGLVEQFYADYPRDVFSGKLSVAEAVQSLIELANQNNGQDNTSVVLTYCAVSPQYPVVLNLGESPMENNVIEFNLDTEFASSSVNFESEQSAISDQSEATTSNQGVPKLVLGIVGVLVFLLSAGAALLTAHWLLNPEGFNQIRDRFFPPKQQQLPLSQGESISPQTD